MQAAMQAMIRFSQCKCGMDQIEQQLRDPDHRPTFHDPALCPNGKHDVYWPPIVCMSIVHWSRNQLVVNARKSSDYILFCDSDIVVEPDYLERMLMHEKDIVAGLCTRRVDPAVPNFRTWVEEVQNYGEIVTWDPDEILLEVDAVGTGLMLISRRVLNDLAEAFHPAAYRRDGNGWWFEFIRAAHLDMEFGEDISLCWKAQRLGYKIYVDTTIQPGHLDLYAYGLKDYLPYQQDRAQTLLRAARAAGMEMPPGSPRQKEAADEPSAALVQR